MGPLLPTVSPFPSLRLLVHLTTPHSFYGRDYHETEMPFQFVMHILTDFKNWGSQKINSIKCSTIWSWIQCNCSSLFTNLTPVCWSQTLIRLRSERNESGKNHHEIQIALISPSSVQRYILRCILFLHIPVLGSWSSSHPLEVFSFGRNTWKSQQPSHTHHVPSGYKCMPLPQVEKHTTPAWF